jgi:urate oxidase
MPWLPAGDGTVFRVESGIDDLTIMKTTASGREGYLKDPFTMLPETDDRILGTALSANWR